MKRMACLLGTLCFLLPAVAVFAQQPAKPASKPVVKIDKAEFTRITTEYDQLQRDLKELELQRAQINRLAKEYNDRLVIVNQNLEKLEGGYDKALSADTNNKPTEASKQLRAIQRSFGSIYLQLSQQVQQENKQYNTITAILKTKHDTVKNSVSNIR